MSEAEQVEWAMITGEADVITLLPEERTAISRKVGEIVLSTINNYGEPEAVIDILGQIPFITYEILTLLDEGASRAQAAANLGMTPDNLSIYVQRVYELLGVGKPADAIAILSELLTMRQIEIVPPPEPARPASPTRLGRETLPQALSELSNQELDVLGCLCLGMTNKQIAAHCFLQTATIKFHLSNVYRKLGVSRRTEALIWAARCGLVEWAMSLEPPLEGRLTMENTRRGYSQMLGSDGVPGPAASYQSPSTY